VLAVKLVLPLALLVLANALWGASYVVAKVALEELPAPLLAALRFSLAVLVLWLVIGWRARFARTGPRLPSPGDTWRLLGLGVLGVAMNGLLGYWGVSLTTATDAALLIVGEVLFTTLLAIALAGEYLGRVRGIGLATGLVGVVVLIAGGGTDQTALAPARPLGDVLILVGLGFEAAYTVLGTRQTRRYDPLVVLTLSFSGSCLVWLPVIGWYALRGGLAMPSPVAALGVLYLALVNSVACYLLWFGVLRSAGATLGALSLLAQPVVGAALGVLVLGDPVLPTTLIGGACVLVCLVLAALAPGRAQTHPAP
jgi:drug/metabolite transporter (DMT)-like permease